MKKDLTKIVFALDRNDSMGGLENDVIAVLQRRQLGDSWKDEIALDFERRNKTTNK
ncbi:MAG: hypothetical protein WC292_01140 [Clostridia bacterium]